MSRLPVLLASAIFAVCTASKAASNLVVNGDFESPNAVTISCYQNATADSWTTFGPLGNRGSCLVESLYASAGLVWPASRSGTQMMYVNYLDDVGTGVRQSVSLVANTTYQLSFSLAGIAGDVGTPNVSVALGNGVGSQSFSSAANSSWSDKSWSFTALSSGPTTLSFTATGGPVVIDLVSLSVSAIPEPRSGFMFAAGLTVLLGFVLRRRAYRD